MEDASNTVQVLVACGCRANGSAQLTVCDDEEQKKQAAR